MLHELHAQGVCISAIARQTGLDRVSMHTEADLRNGALTFEHKHNTRYRYSHLNGKTPLTILAQSGPATLHWPPHDMAPKTPLAKPETGCYHLIRLICSDGKLNI